ncbi:uncharacterized protein [Paralichthys olivaceus]|uniref:uncharacterized protein isoform X2 n=1 Tax=Paralichthys olivaceus TaxID=8255 RepID=UPI003751E827
MEEPELPADDRRFQRFQRFPVWIIEHVWTHRTMDIQQVVDPSDWPDVDSQPLSIEDSWRLRVASAQAFCIVKNRDMEHFERVLKFLEATHRLLPRLVAPIKHMKIVFGLKTLNQHEMFLMRKNNLDFKVLAQALVMDKDKLEYYVQKRMEQHYGEHYAQRVEDRLLQYLQELEAALPGDTFIDKILKKESPVTDEEKLLLDVITSDSTTIAMTLRKLLHCDAASCRPAVVSQASEHGATEVENSGLTKSVVCRSSSNTRLSSVEDKTPHEFQPEVLERGDVAAQEVSVETHNHPDVGRRLQTKEEDEIINRAEETGLRASEAASSPQFCSKHQRWVKSILQECPDECSEELQLQANVSSSPPLFQSSSSTSSSQDLTPSDLIPCPPDRQLTPSQTATRPPTASEQGDVTDERRSGSASDGSLQQRSSRDAPLSSALSPVVRLMDVTSVRGSCPFLKPHHASPNTFMSRNKQAASTPHSPQDSGSSVPTNITNTTNRSQTSPLSHDASTFSCCRKPTPQTSSRRAAAASRRAQTLDVAEQFKQAPASHLLSSHHSVSSSSAHESSASQSEALSSNRNPSSPRSFRQNDSPLLSQTDPRTSSTSSTSSTSNTDHLPVRSEASSAQLRLSLRSQAVLLQSALLQPYVSLTRLSARESQRPTRSRRVESESLDPDSSFDLNILYSSHSSSGDCDDSLDSDPDYKPPTERRRRVSEYDAAETLNHSD